MTEANTIKACLLINRGCITLSGQDRFTFLQAIITQDMNELEKTPLIYGCLLTPQGKFLHDFFIRLIDDAIIIDCEGGARSTDLYRKLSMYKLRSDVILTMHEETPVWQIFSTNGTEWKPPLNNVFIDPRHPNAGWRCYDEKPPEGIIETSFEIWDRHRIQNCIPDGSRDLIPEKSFIHEGRLDEFNAVSYSKGCYVGQELVSRMHHRGLSKKTLQTVKLDDLPEDADLRSSCDDIGLAVVKINY